MNKSLDLNGKHFVITGGAGFLGRQHAEAIIEGGGIPILWDIDEKKLKAAQDQFKKSHAITVIFQEVDVTSENSIISAVSKLEESRIHPQGLINNAALDPKVNNGLSPKKMRLENFSIEQWDQELNVGLKGAFLCSKILGHKMAEEWGGGVIINIASDLSVFAPDQRIYKKEGLHPLEQPTKPVTYSVIKTGLIGLTKYLATYWAEKNVRSNALSPAGVFGNEPTEFVNKLTSLIPMGRMAKVGEYKGAIIFLCSDASKYMTGQNIVIDGGRSVW